MLNRQIGTRVNMNPASTYWIEATKASMIRRPSETVVLFESAVGWTSMAHIDIVAREISGTPPGFGYGRTGINHFMEPHRGRSNILFADSHVSRWTFAEAGGTTYLPNSAARCKWTIK